MKKKLILLLASFILTPAFLFFCIIYFSYQSFENNKSDYLSLQNQGVAFAAIPDDFIMESATVDKDARVEILSNFFAKYKSELEPYAEDIVETSDKYGLDYRLLPSIAMQESNLCKKAPKDSFNCWGFGIYGKKVTRFENFPQAIETVTKTLAQDYGGMGLITPEQIVKLYTPSSNGSWQNSVNYFINQLQ
ncbi:MAG: hypothetical protein A2W22_04515 [Candidatus Levybacteria bacterium RBG_16_35_11]|nr:MAG: hypothetical protein A2W22_04515 [Candidatus Levybacteria bacterium RBG_16_35_11]